MADEGKAQASNVSENEATVRAFLAAMNGGTVSSFTAACAFVSVHGTYRPNGWKQPVAGREAVLVELCGTGAHYSGLDIEILTCTTDGDRVVMERIDHFVMQGKPIDLHVVGIFELGPDGLIDSWRDYYDRKEVEAQLRG